MIVVRPARLDDLGPLYDLSLEAGPGMTSLPQDEALLRARIEASLDGFAKPSPRPMASFIF